MVRSTLFLLFLTAVLSCKKDIANPSADIEICGVKDPINNLAWLKKLVEEAKRNNEEDMLRITAFTYQGKTYINQYKMIWSCIGNEACSP